MPPDPPSDIVDTALGQLLFDQIYRNFDQTTLSPGLFGTPNFIDMKYTEKTKLTNGQTQYKIKPPPEGYQYKLEGIDTVDEILNFENNDDEEKRQKYQDNKKRTLANSPKLVLVKEDVNYKKQMENFYKNIGLVGDYLTNEQKKIQQKTNENGIFDDADTIDRWTGEQKKEDDRIAFEKFNDEQKQQTVQNDKYIFKKPPPPQVLPLIQQSQQQLQPRYYLDSAREGWWQDEVGGYRDPRQFEFDELDREYLRDKRMNDGGIKYKRRRKRFKRY
jgi:hypothetical protein